MVCAYVQEDNPRALASGLSPLHKRNHTIIFFVHQHACVHCEIFDVKYWNIIQRCNKLEIVTYNTPLHFINTPTVTAKIKNNPTPTPTKISMVYSPKIPTKDIINILFKSYKTHVVHFLFLELVPQTNLGWSAVCGCGIS